MNPLYLTLSAFAMFVIVAYWEIEKHDGVASRRETLIPSSEKVGHIVIA
jgi:hypothetical protein